MSEFNIEPTCPRCGANLLVEQLGVEPEPHDRVLCPVHGCIGRRDEVSALEAEKLRDEFGKKVADDFGEMLRGLGFDAERG